MKKLFIVSFLGLCLGLAGCGDDDDNGNGNGTPDAGVTDDGGTDDGGTDDGGVDDGGTDDGGTTTSACPDSVYCIDGEEVAPTIGVATATVITADEREFKDLSGNGELDPYEDWRLSPEERAADLVGRMDIDQKIGLLTEGGLGVTPENEQGSVTQAQIDAITDDHVRTTLLRWPNAPVEGSMLSAGAVARQMNKLQELAEGLPLGIPMLFTTDPIFGAASDMTSSMLMHQNMSNQIIDWPLTLGLGAIDDEAYVKEIAAAQAAQLRAVGIRWMLGPQAELATEPMWSRVYDTFGSRADRVGALATAYVQGFQGKDDGVHPFNGVAATVKHFPGGGANENGMDSHSEPGRFAIYPGDNFEEHVTAIRPVIEDANPAAIMPVYSILEDVTWNGEPVEQISAHFSQVLLIDLLREDMGWDGMVTSDWGGVGACFAPGNCPSFSAWGTEEWTNAERMAAYLEAGGHQIGLWQDSRLMWEDALTAGTITEDQVSHAAQKVLEVIFKVGAFEDPYVDDMAADAFIESFAPMAHEAMTRAFTLLKNEGDVLPLDAETVDQNGTEGIQVYFDGHDDAAIAAYAAAVPGFEQVTDLALADYAVVRISARHGNYFGLDGGVPLSYRDPILVYDQETDSPSDVPSEASGMGGSAEENNAAAAAIADTLDAVVAAKEGNPNLKLIVAVSMYRPFVIEPWLGSIDVLAAEFGMTDAALLDMVFQMRDMVQDTSLQPTGTLPMEIPSSQDAVYEAFEDVPHDSADPTFEVGAGILAY